MSDTSKREELIEEAAKAIYAARAAHDGRTWDGLEDHEWEAHREKARAAFAVFEKAHAPTAPTDDEREALQALDILHRYAFGSNEIGREQVSNMVEIISDYLRRAAVQEPSIQPTIDEHTDSAWQAIADALGYAQRECVGLMLKYAEPESEGKA